MSVKRKEKQEKRKKKRIKSGLPATKSHSPKKPDSPYSNKKDVLEDVDLMQAAVEKHYGEVSDDFIPPLFEDAESGQLSEWVGTFRDLMQEKYIDTAIVEAKVKFILSLLSTTS